MKKNLTLSELRKAHLEEIKKNLDVAISIRDDTKAGDKERINAIKEINWMLGVRKPEKAEQKPDEKKKEQELTEAEKKTVLDLIHAQ